MLNFPVAFFLGNIVLKPEVNHRYDNPTMSTEVNQTVSKVKGAIEDESITEQESGFRYAAYANRLRTILLASHRYVAYTSDIGESFRPVAHPYLVKSGYAVSWLYILGDVSYASWITKMKAEGRYEPGLKPWDKAPAPNEIAAKTFTSTHSLVDSDWRWSALKRYISEYCVNGVARLTIHSSVRYSSYLFKIAKFQFSRLMGQLLSV